MRSLLISAVIALLPTSAMADHMRPGVELRTLDAPCRTLAMVPSDARTVTPLVDANISVAGCLATTRVRALVLTPTPASVDAMNQAIQPAFQLLDTIIRTGDVRAQIMAQHAKADIYDGLAVRLIATVPPVSPMATGQALLEHDQRITQMNILAQPWRDHAKEGFRQVAELGAQIPDAVATNPVLAFAVSDSRFESSTATARR
jgi:hypothetical protein